MKKTFIFCILIISMLLIGVNTVEAVDYSINGSDPELSGLTIEWTKNIGSGSLSSASPALSPDNETIYFANGVERKLLAVNTSDGSEKWFFTLGTTTNSAIQSSVSVDNSGVVYVPTGTGGTGNIAKVYAVNPTGSQKWVHDIVAGANIQYMTPVIAKSGNIVVGNRGTGGSIRILDSTNGTLIASNDSGTAVEAENIVATQDDYIYTMSRSASNGVFSYNIGIPSSFYNTALQFMPSGTVYTVGSMAVDDDGNVYGASGTGSVFSIKNNGTSIDKNWEYAVPSKIEQSGVVIGEDGSVYVNGHQNNRIFALTAQGVLKWTFETESSASSTPAIDNNGWLHFGDDAGYYYVIKDNETSAELLHKKNLGNGIITTSRIWSSPLIASDGAVYFTTTAKEAGNQDDNVYMFKITIPNVTAPANSAWAMRNGNAQRTGLQKENTPTSIKDISNDKVFDVFTKENLLEIETSQTGKLMVMDIAGSIIFQQAVDAGSVTLIPINNKSIYVVKLNDKVKKIIN